LELVALRVKLNGDLSVLALAVKFCTRTVVQTGPHIDPDFGVWISMVLMRRGRRFGHAYADQKLLKGGKLTRAAIGLGRWGREPLHDHNQQNKRCWL
jgi:hypothetical protein